MDKINLNDYLWREDQIKKESGICGDCRQAMPNATALRITDSSLWIAIDKDNCLVKPPLK